MDFASDNTVGAHELVLDALRKANSGTATSYGYDPWTRKAEAALSAVFEREVETYLVLTGTAANALALSSICPAYGSVLCHEESHVNTDECGAVEFFSGGRLTGLWAPSGKLDEPLITKALDLALRGEHESKPSAISITQATELGTVYSVEEVSAFGRLCKRRGLRLHMDGARFANAVSFIGCTPADLTWKAGVDVMTFGATKNGALALEAVVFFDTSLAEEFRRRRKRAGQLLSKGRFLGAQMLAYLKDDLWLKNSQHANRMAALLAELMGKVKAVRLPLPTQANEVFAILPRTLHDGLLKHGAHYHEWPGKGPGTDTIGKTECFARFVTSFKTTDQEIKKLVQLVKRLTK
jgi:threonine aldolase